MSCRIDKLAHSPVEALDLTVNVQAAAEFMAQKDIGLVVVTEHGQVIGLFTEKDMIRRVVGAGRTPDQLSLGEVCSRNLISIQDTENCETAIKLMHANRCRRLLLYRGDSFLGVVTLQRVASELAYHRSRRNTVVNLVGGVTLAAAVCLIALWLYQLPDMARLAMQIMK